MTLMRRYTLLFATLLVGCSGATNGTDGQDKTGDTLTIIHLNDTYRVDAVEEGRRGGFSRIATLVRRLQSEGRDVRITHGGDFLYPSLESQLWDGEQMVEVMNFLDDLAPMYVVPGNHEFDRRTPEHLIRRIHESRFDWIADNVQFATGDAEADGRLESGFTFVAGDKTIGVFALTLHADDGGNARDYASIDGDYVRNAERMLGRFSEDGVDLVFGLTHLHLVDDIRIAALKERYPEYAFIVGGHEHEPEHEFPDTGNAEIVKGASNARTIWRIDIRFADDGASIDTKMVEVDETVPLDPQYEVIARKWRERLLATIPFLPSRIGDAAVPLDGREVKIRNGDSNWGHFIVDQMRTAFGDPAADLAFINAGTFRIDDFVAEDITFEDIGRTFGFSSYLRYMTMSGAEFRETLEAGYRGYGPSKGYFPQVSGFRVCVDRSRPDGQRIVQLQLPMGEAWQEIQAEKDYSVVAPDYIYRGGDGYDFSKARAVSRPGSELRYLVLDAVIRAQAAGKKVGEALTADNARFAELQPGDEYCFN